MPARVAVFRTERRAERVNLAHRHAVGFDVELARDGERCLSAEEVFGEIDLALGRARDVRQVERAHFEHLARALGIGGGDDRRMNPEEAALVKEPMDRLRETMPHARHCAKRVRARPKVGNVAQIFEAVLFGRNRIRVRIIDPADDFHVAGLNLIRLAFALRFDQRAGDDRGTAGGHVKDFVRVIRQRRRRDNLNRIEA